MNFWKVSGYKYEDVVEMPHESLVNLINSLSRDEIIDWLCWNDPNGIYDDELSQNELGNILTYKEGREIMIRQIQENRIIQ